MSNQYRSSEIDQISGALAKAQGGYKKLVANELCPGGKFANLQGIYEAVRPSMSENGLAIFQHIELLDEGSGASLLKTTISHSSGQFIASVTRIVTGKSDKQSGNTLEIHKRLQALMLLGIAPSESDPVAFDDNGTNQSEELLIEKLKKPREEKKLDYEETITKDQYNDLLIELDGYPDILQDVLGTYGLTTLQDLPKSEYHKSVGKIRKIKKTVEDYERRR